MMGFHGSSSPVPQMRLRPGAQAKRELRRLIEEGALPVGQRLPPELKLAERLGVARGTLRTAFAELEAEGVLKHVPGKGRVVLSVDRPVSNALVKTVVHLTWPHEDVALAQRGWMEAVDMGISAALKDAGLHVLTLRPDDTTEERVDQLIADRPRGVLLSHTTVNLQCELVQLFAQAKLPIVSYGDERSVRSFDRVVSDHRFGARELTRWLVAQGRRRILRVWHKGLSWEWLKERNKGVEEAIRKARAKLIAPARANVMERSIKGGTREELEERARPFARAIKPHLRGRRPIDAIELITDADVFPVAVALRQLGVTPNQEVLIAGYDNYWASCWEREFEPTAPVVTVDKFNRASGARMVRMLLELPASKPRRKPELCRIKPRLIITGKPDRISDLLH